jgi:hypothetical protein
MMLKTLFRTTAMLAFLLTPFAAAAAEDDAKLVESVSPQIADVVTGGSWSDGKQGGLYRAFVVMSGSEADFGARVYLQWLTLSDDSPIPGVVQTIPIKEVNEQNLPNASIQIDGEENKDNEVYVVVSAYDFDNVNPSRKTRIARDSTSNLTEISLISSSWMNAIGAVQRKKATGAKSSNTSRLPINSA